jgi:hypothetical protein
MLHRIERRFLKPYIRAPLAVPFARDWRDFEGRL